MLVRARVDGAGIGISAREIRRYAGHVAQKKDDMAVVVDARYRLRAEVAMDERIGLVFEDRGGAFEVGLGRLVGEIGLDEPVGVVGDQAQAWTRWINVRSAGGVLFQYIVLDCTRELRYVASLLPGERCIHAKQDSGCGIDRH